MEVDYRRDVTQVPDWKYQNNCSAPVQTRTSPNMCHCSLNTSFLNNQICRPTTLNCVDSHNDLQQVPEVAYINCTPTPTPAPNSLQNVGQQVAPPISPQEENWKGFFDQYDNEGFGEISIEDFQTILYDPRFREDMDPHKLDVLESKAGEQGRVMVSYQEFINIMSNKRSRSFQIAVHCRDRESWGERNLRLQTRHPQCFERMVRRVAKEFLVDERDRQYYADHYTCCPPPIFVPAVTLIEVAFFIYYSFEAGDVGPSGPVPANSIFIYRPDKRIEIWRFLFYMLIHAGWVHLFFNMLVQLLVGVPLEMVHGSFRIGTVYMAGVLAGSLGTSVFDMDAFLVGASGGVYALLAAHLANILLNYSEMELGILKLAAVFVIASADVGFAIWDRYTSDDQSPPVGYVSHLMGALAGLTIGLLVLKNFEQKLHAQVMWWVALGVYTLCTLFAVLWNIFYY